MSFDKGWGGARSLLCIRLDSMGELLMTTPALRALKEGHTRRNITLLTTPSGARLAPMLNMADEVITQDSRHFPDVELIRRLRVEDFDGAVIFNSFWQDPLPAARLAADAGIPLRLAQSPDNPSGLLTQWVQESDHAGQPTLRHEVRRQLELVRAIGYFPSEDSLSLNVAPETVGSAASLLDEVGLEISRPWVVIHPGVTEPSRRYPAVHFAEAARQLAESHGFQILFTGSPQEKELVEQVRMQMHEESFSLAGQLDLETLSAVLFLAPLLISNNNAPVHIAAALQTPVVDLYALTHPHQTPWKVPHRTLYFDVPCKFCYSRDCPLVHHNCLERVPPAEVVRAVLDLLRESRRIEEMKRLSSLYVL